jgi:MoxR-like ATPase
VDRFMMKVLVGYPTEEEEFVIVDRVTGIANDVVPMATTEQLRALQRDCRSIYVDPALKQYAVRLASATRDPDRFGVADVAKYVSFGASPRASINLIEVKDLVPDVFRHRLVLTYEALAEGITPDQLIYRIMQHIAAPDKPLETHVKVAVS